MNSVSEEELLHVLMCMPRNKSPGVNGLRKEFHETLGEDLQTPLYQVLGQHFIRVNFANTSYIKRD